MSSLSRRKALLYLGNSSIGLLSSYLLGCQSTPSSMIKTKSKAIDLIAKIQSLKQIAPAKHSHDYQPPTTGEWQRFQDLADAFYSENIEKAQELAKTLNYRLIKFREQSSNQTLLGLLEQQDEQGTIRGWGSYFINPVADSNALVESPHILFDRLTPEIAGQVFLLSKARGFLMAGAHRNANGLGSADVCNPIQSIFQAVHQCWTKDGATTWQIHGFANPIAKGFPKNTQIVLSTGKGQVSEPIFTLEQILEERGFSSYVYNELSAESAINQKLNEQVSGITFSPLAGTQNVQGIYSRQIGVPFLHIEIESHVRSQQKSREKVASAIADAIVASY